MPSHKLYKLRNRNIENIPEFVEPLSKGEKRTKIWKNCIGSARGGIKYLCLICQIIAPKKNGKKKKSDMKPATFKDISNLMKHIETQHLKSSIKIKSFKNKIHMRNHIYDVHEILKFSHVMKGSAN